MTGSDDVVVGVEVESLLVASFIIDQLFLQTCSQCRFGLKQEFVHDD